MARILQIRRGTTVQNDNFTGQSGELSFDTDTKTLRVHDGEKLGGYPLARAGTASIAAPFDINSVPNEFWERLFSRFTVTSDSTPGGDGTGLNVLESIEIPILNVSTFEYTIETTATARLIQVVLICKSDDAGYVAGDVCTAFGLGDNTNAMTFARTDASGMTITMFVNDEEYWVPDLKTAARNKIDPSKWNLQFRVYC